jgi:hypothetical protein
VVLGDYAVFAAPVNNKYFKLTMSVSAAGDRYIVSSILSKLGLRDQFRAKQVCRAWNTMVDIRMWPEIYQTLTGTPFPWLHYMLLKYSDRPWSYSNLSVNPSITPEIIFDPAFAEKKWDWHSLCQNPALS